MRNYFTFKKTAILLFSIFFVALLTWFFFYQKSYRSPFQSIHPIEAIPNYAPIIFEFDDYYQLKDSIAKMPYSRELGQFNLVKKVSDDFESFRKIFSEVEDFRSLLTNAQVAASCHLTGNSQVDLLYVFKNEKLRLKVDPLLSEFPNKASQRAGQKIYQLSIGNRKITIADFHGLFLISKHAYLVEGGMKQLKTPSTNLWQTNKLKPNRKSKRKRNEIDLYIIFENLESFSNSFFKRGTPSYIEYIAQFSYGFNCLLEFSKEGIKLNGRLKSNFVNTLLQNIFSNKRKITSNAYSILPSNLTYVFQQPVGDEKDNPIHSKDFQKYFQPWIGEEWLVGRTEVFTRTAKGERFVALHCTDPKLADYHLKKMVYDFGELKQWNHQTYRITQVSIDSLELPEVEFEKVNFRNPYFTIINDYVIFAGSGKMLENWIDDFLVGKTYSKSQDALKAISAINQDYPNHFFWNNVSAQRFFQILFNPSNSDIKSQLQKLKSFPMIGLSANWEKEEMYFDGFIFYNKEYREDVKIRWRSFFSIDLKTPPKALFNSERDSYEILVQDITNTLYLLDANGREIWRRELANPILSDFHLMQLSDVESEVIIFNTEDEIHMIDFEGETKNEFPIKLKSNATNSISIASFSEKEFGIFLAANSNSLIGIDQKGVPLKGWEDINVEEVIHPIQHFQTEDEDLFFIQNNNGDILFYDKKGDHVFSQEDFCGEEKTLCVLIDSLGKCFYVADKAGVVRKLCLENKTKIEAIDLTDENIKFTFDNFGNDKLIDFLKIKNRELEIFYQEQDSFQLKGSTKLTCLPDEVFSVPSQNLDYPMIGTLCKKDNRIYLFDQKLNLHPDFPLEGDIQFQLVPLFSEDKNALIVGNKDQVIVYELPDVF